MMFVCLGNICRSPLAEAVLKKLLKDRGLEDKFYVESSGTASYHIGENADSRTRAVAQRYSVPMNHTAQQFSIEHLSSFKHIVVMDDSNLNNVLNISPAVFEAQIHKFRDFDPLDPGADVPDPWYGGVEGFEENYQITLRCSENLLNYLLNEYQ